MTQPDAVVQLAHNTPQIRPLEDAPKKPDTRNNMVESEYTSSVHHTLHSTVAINFAALAGVSVRSYTSRLHEVYGLIAPLTRFSSLLLPERGGRKEMTAICEHQLA